jgi:hypothetical protein
MLDRRKSMVERHELNFTASTADLDNGSPPTTASEQAPRIRWRAGPR